MDPDGNYGTRTPHCLPVARTYWNLPTFEFKLIGGNQRSDQHTEEEKELMREEASRLDAIAAVVIILSLTAAAYFYVSSQ